MAVGQAPRYDPGLEVLEHFLLQIGRQFPFATAQALNDVAAEFQNYQRIHQELTFTIREKQFFRFAIKRRRQDNASPKNLESVVWIDDRVRRVKGFSTASRPDIWERLQFERTRKPKKGNRFLAVPTDNVKRNARGLIRPGEFPQDPNRSRKKNTFVVPFPSGEAGLFRRIGRRQKAFVKRQPGTKSPRSLKDDPNVEFLYVLKRKTALKPDFNFFENAHFVFERTWGKAWERRLIGAFRTIRFRRGGFR